MASYPIPLATSVNPNPSAPLKLTFRLGPSSQISASTPLASTSTSEDMDVDSSQQDNVSEGGSSALGSQGIDDGRAPLQWDNRGKLPKTTVGTTLEGEAKPKQRRKRGPKRPPGEAGPGKSWRKGLKGNLAGTGAPPRAPSANPTPYSYKPQASTSGSTSAAASTSNTPARIFPVGQAPKLAASYLPPLALEIKTPRPRKWTRSYKELTSVSGTLLKFRTWKGRSTSAYFDATQAARTAAAALALQQAPKAHSADIPLRSPLPSHASSPAPSPAQFSLSPHPLPVPQFAPLIPNQNSTVAALVATAALRTYSGEKE